MEGCHASFLCFIYFLFVSRFEQLVQEAINLDVRHEDSVVHSLILLEKFILDDLTAISNVMVGDRSHNLIVKT